MKILEENYFVSSKSNPVDKIFFKRLIPNQKRPKKVILFFHDARLHSDVFNDFLKKIIKYYKDVEVYSFDIIGHGRSGGERMGPIDSHAIIDDVDEVMKKIREITDLPIYFIGVGFGSQNYWLFG